ncbi:MAG: TolC family protein, partial [Rhodobacteraceae bacterium]|nr:TolC family protein [Paracoccaceae bacterium]
MKVIRDGFGGILWSSVLVLVAGVNAASGAEPVALETLSVDAVVAKAVRDNPSLAEMQTRYEALSEVPSQAGSLPDPIVNVGAANFPLDTFARAQEPMTQLNLGVSQAFPFPGKLALREEAAEHDAKAAEHSVDEARLQLVRKVKNKWWQLYYVDRALETVKQNQTLLEQFIEVAKTKYETGKGLQQDVLLAQLELSKLLDREIQLDGIRRQQAIQLNILMDDTPEASVTLPTEVERALPVLVSERALYEQANGARPLLRQLETNIAAAQARLDLAKREYYPDFTVGMTYGNRTGMNPMPRADGRADFISVMV